LRIVSQIDGVYPDRWSGPAVGYTRYDCRGGTLTVTVNSDRDLHPHRQTIVATTGGRQIGRLVFKPRLVSKTLTVPLVPGKDHCSVLFSVSPTAVPADVIHNLDTRPLGVRFLEFEYRPN
jgi:hypothetical protein